MAVLRVRSFREARRPRSLRPEAAAAPGPPGESQAGGNFPEPAEAHCAPILKERSEQRAGTLSGGQQQMLAVGRALMLDPKVLMLDEPSLGLSPVLVDQIIEALQKLHREQGMTILLVEQNVPAALETCERGYILQTGRIVSHGTSADLLATDLVRKSYLGI